MEQTLIAAADPARANAMAAAALAPDTAAFPREPQVEMPPDTLVKLPGGVSVGVMGQVVKEVEVRELNGFDEEILARVPIDQPGRLFSTILKQGVVRIGDQPATTELLDNLLMGDRDALLLAIRRVTWGDDVELRLRCHQCEDVSEYVLMLTKDVPVKPLDDIDRRFTIQLDSGRTVELHLPDGHTQAAMMALGSSANRGQINTALLATTVDAIDDLAVAGNAPVQRLGLRDRMRLLTELGDRSFGPRLEEVSVPCVNCGEKLLTPLALGTLFPV